MRYRELPSSYSGISQCLSYGGTTQVHWTRLMYPLNNPWVKVGETFYPVNNPGVQPSEFSGVVNSWMKDDPTGGRKKSKSCQQLKVQFWVAPAPFSYEKDSQWEITHDAYPYSNMYNYHELLRTDWYPSFSLPNCSGVGADLFATASYIDLLRLAEKHANACSYPIREQISIANFLLEFHDIKRTLDFIMKPFIRMIHRVRDGILTWRFGVKPFIGDLNSIYRSLGRAARTLKYLRDHQGKDVRVRTYWKKVLDAEPDAMPVSNHGAPTCNPGSYMELRTSFAPLLAEAWIVSRVVYDLSKVSPYEMGAYAAARTFGLDNPLKVLWNAIPYSFVVDWILGVNSMLNQCNLPSQIGAKVRSTTSHYRVTRTVKGTSYYYGWNTDEFFPPVQEIETYQFDAIAYERIVGLPPGALSLIQMNSEQVFLAFLLGEQRFGSGDRRNPKRFQSRFDRIRTAYNDWLKHHH